VDNHVAQLRQKIEGDPKNARHIVTVHGEGYRFVRPRLAEEGKSSVDERPDG
jgi:two-component system alkaline phosphatase synthesis response regulator PhoP